MSRTVLVKAGALHREQNIYGWRNLTGPLDSTVKINEGSTEDLAGLLRSMPCPFGRPFRSLVFKAGARDLLLELSDSQSEAFESSVTYAPPEPRFPGWVLVGTADKPLIEIADPSFIAWWDLVGIGTGQSWISLRPYARVMLIAEAPGSAGGATRYQMEVHAGSGAPASGANSALAPSTGDAYGGVMDVAGGGVHMASVLLGAGAAIGSSFQKSSPAMPLFLTVRLKLIGGPDFNKAGNAKLTLYGLS